MSTGIDLLAGIRIIDLTSVIFGPLATQVLADYGADVIKIEPPEGDIARWVGESKHPDMGSLFLAVNRGKRSVKMDLKDPASRADFEKLVRGADVLVHNIRREPARRLGLGPTDILAINPGIVYAAATGFPAGTSLEDAPAIDDVIQAASGLAAINADEAGNPRYFPTIFADKVGGYALVGAILAALLRKARTGRGCQIDVPMYSTLASFVMVEHLAGHSFEPPTAGTGYRRVLTPARKPFQAADGFISMTPYTAKQWGAFFTAVQRADLAQDARVQDPAQRNAHVDELYRLVADYASKKTVAEWMALCEELSVPAFPVRDLDAVAADPDLASAGVFRVEEHPSEGAVKSFASPGFFDGRVAHGGGHAPKLGEHTEEVLAEVRTPRAV